MGLTGSRSAEPVRLVHAGGHVEHYHRKVTVEELMRRNPQHCVARPEVFKSPSGSLLAPEAVLVPGDKLLLVPIRTVKKLYRKHGLVVPAIKLVPRTDGSEIYSLSPAGKPGCKPGCVKPRVDSNARSSRLGDAAHSSGGAIQPKETGADGAGQSSKVEPGRRSRYGASRGRESPRRGARTPTHRTPTRRSSTTRNPTQRPPPRTPPRRIPGNRTPTRRVLPHKTPTPTHRLPSQGASRPPAPKQRVTHTPKRSKPSPDRGGEKNSVPENVWKSRKTLREGLDAKHSGVGVCKSGCMIKVFPVQDHLPEQLVTGMNPVPEVHHSSKADSQVQPTTEAAPPTKTVESEIVDVKYAAGDGDSSAKRSQQKQLGGEGKQDNIVDALVKTITNMALLNAQTSLCQRQSLIPTPHTVKDMIAMFEALQSGRCGKDVTPYCDAVSVLPHLDIGSQSTVLTNSPVPQHGIAELTMTSSHVRSSSPDLLHAVSPLAYVTSLQLIQENAVDPGHLSKDDGFTCLQSRASQTLQELIARDKREHISEPTAGDGTKHVSRIANSERRQKNDLSVHKVLSEEPNASPDSYIELDLERMSPVTEGDWKAADIGRLLAPQDPTSSNRRSTLRDHLQIPTNVPSPCVPPVDSSSPKGTIPDEPEESGDSSEPKRVHEKVAAESKPPRKRRPPRRIPGPFRLTGRRRYIVPWRPALSPLIEVPSEGCSDVHSMR